MAALLDPYRISVRTIAYGRIRGVSDRSGEADRVAQDVMVRLISALDKGVPFSVPFHVVVAANLRFALKDLWRDRGSEEARARDPSELPDLAGVADDTSSAVEQARLFEPYLIGLTERERTLIIERIFLDMTSEQSAAKHGMTRNAVYQANHQTLKKLRANLPQRDVRKRGKGAA